jgi:hypothetical protein
MNMTNTTTDREQELLRKAVRARSLVDPLGAMGFRQTSHRVRRESRIRRWAFGLTTTGFALILGAIVVTAPGSQGQQQRVSEAYAGVNGQLALEQGLQSSQVRSQQPSHTRTRGS